MTLRRRRHRQRRRNVSKTTPRRRHLRHSVVRDAAGASFPSAIKGIILTLERLASTTMDRVRGVT